MGGWKDKRHYMRTNRTALYRRVFGVIRHTKYSRQYVATQFPGRPMRQRLRWNCRIRSEDWVPIRNVSTVIGVITHGIIVVVSIVPIY